MKKTFNILKCKAVDELLYLFGLKKGEQYKIVKKDNYEVCSLNLSDDNTHIIAETLKGVNIYIPNVGVYISDFILLKKKPTEKILKYINFFTYDNLFLPFVSDQRLLKAKNAIEKKNKE